MGLAFIIGPAGSGKTKYVTESVIEALLEDGSRPVLLLVPDQATFQMEKKILEDGRIKGFMDLHVLSFRRLCHRVLQETGGLGKPFITATGKKMAIQSILWKRRGDLRAFASMVSLPGFRDTLGKAFAEFSAYGVGPQDIVAVTGSGDVPFLDQKIHDLELIFKDYKAFLQGRFTDPDDYMALAAERIAGSSLVQGAAVFIDGFSGFNPTEYRVLGEIMKYSESVRVALCLDARETWGSLSRASVFLPTRETYHRIRELASACGVPELMPVILGEDEPLPRFKDSPDLAALEEGIRSSLGCRGPGATYESRFSESPGVRIVAARNLRSEVEFVAREILTLVRDRNLRFRDITVETRDLHRYADLISMVFSDHKIPHFLDRKESLSHHPVSELVRASLDAVASDFSYEPVMRYLKTDLVPVERGEVDILENYVLAHGIRGSLWVEEKPWRFSKRFLLSEEAKPEEEAGSFQADQIRRSAMRHLARFYARIGESTGSTLTAKKISDAVYDLLMDLDVPRTLEEWESQARESGDVSSAMEHAGVWDGIMEILEQSSEILGDEPCSLEEYISILNAGLEDIRLGKIPPSLDQVLVGGLERSRQPECAVTFLLGASAGVFPAAKSEDSLLTDREREYLSSRGIELEPSSTIRQLHENYLVYIALTRPSKMLCVTYPLGDEEGKALSPSYVLEYVKRFLPGLKEEYASLEPTGDPSRDIDFALPARICGVAARMLSRLRDGLNPGDLWMDVYRTLLEPEGRDLVPKARMALSSLSFSNSLEPLDQDRVKKLYGRTILTSVSRLERFGQCPFQHFAVDGLGLRERDIFRIEPATAGTFLHEAMRDIVTQLAKDENTWQAFAAGGLDTVVDDAIDRMIPSVMGEILTTSARYRELGEAFRRIARRAYWILREHAANSKYVPLATEVRFGIPGGLPPVSIRVTPKDQVLLRGQIDRVDIALKDGVVYVRVVDYKSSPHSLDIQSVFQGLSLQLLVYMIAVLSSWDRISGGKEPPPDGILRIEPGLKGATVIPAGALYFTLKDPMIEVEGPVDENKARSKLMKFLKMSGLLAGDAGSVALMDLKRSGYSELIPVYFSKDGGLGRNSSCVSPNDFEKVLRFVRHKIQEMSKGIFGGDISIKPYKMGNRRACTHCPMGALCVFDVLTPGSDYRIIKKASKEEIWGQIRSLLDGGVCDGA